MISSTIWFGAITKSIKRPKIKITIADLQALLLMRKSPKPVERRKKAHTTKMIPKIKANNPSPMLMRMVDIPKSNRAKPAIKITE